MATPIDGEAKPSATDHPASPTNRKLKILMLHGYTQSGPSFHAKTRALEKILEKQISSRGNASCLPGYLGGLQLIYPTAPFRLSTQEIPGFLSGSEKTDEDIDRWAWWTREKDCDKYKGLEQGLATIADVIRANDGIDGVIGFSQGAAAAALVASLLEPGRRQIFDQVHEEDDQTLAFPKEWYDLNSMVPNGLKFAVAYSGFQPSHPAYRAFFEPKIQTPTLHFIGSLDTVLDEARSKALVEKCVLEKRKLVFHPGGHFVPNDKRMVSILVAFIFECMAERTNSN